VPTIRQSIHIERPPEAVFEVLCDLSRLPEWNTAVVAVETVSNQPTNVGTSFVQISRVAGRTVESQMKVVAYDPPGLFDLEGRTPGGGQALIHHTIDHQPNGSLLTLEMSLTLPGGVLGRIAAKALTGRDAEHDLVEHLGRLKRLVENES
jgi:uncharacterized membrane protein